MNCMQCAKVLSLHSKTPYPNAIKIERCFGCGIPMKTATDFYYCDSHNNYFICSECRMCKKGHFLQKVRYLNKINPLYSNNGFGCDICGKSKIVTDNGIWHCSACCYDVCEECLP